MLCHCVTAANRARYSRQLDQMFRQRHEVFVDGLGWREIRRPDSRDVDAYDTEDTVYLMVIDDEGDVVASTRMNPTWGRHQLEAGGELRTRFASIDPPRGPGVWEGSRLVGGFPERYGREHARATLAILMAGTQEFCVRRGVTQGVSIFELNAVSRLQSAGWETQPLGLPVRYATEKGEGEALSVIWKAGVEIILKVREATGVAGPVLFEAPPVMGEEGESGLPYQLLNRVSAIRSPLVEQEMMGLLTSVLAREAAGVAARIH
jgi:acyl-homoserine lactone synthase